MKLSPSAAEILRPTAPLPRERVPLQWAVRHSQTGERFLPERDPSPLAAQPRLIQGRLPPGPIRSRSGQARPQRERIRSRSAWVRRQLEPTASRWVTARLQVLGRIQSPSAPAQRRLTLLRLARARRRRMEDRLMAMDLLRLGAARSPMVANPRQRALAQSRSAATATMVVFRRSLRAPARSPLAVTPSPASDHLRPERAQWLSAMPLRQAPRTQLRLELVRTQASRIRLPSAPARRLLARTNKCSERQPTPTPCPALLPRPVSVRKPAQRHSSPRMRPAISPSLLSARPNSLII